MMVLYWLLFIVDLLVPRFVIDFAYFDDDDDGYDIIFRWNILLDEGKVESNTAIKSLNIFGLGFFPTFYEIVYEEESE